MVNEWYKPAYFNNAARENTGLEDALLRSIIDFIGYDLQKLATNSSEIYLEEVLFDYLDQYCIKKNPIFRADLPNGIDKIDICSLEELFDYLYLYGIKDNICNNLYTYLRYANCEAYDATLFFAGDFKTDIEQFYSDEELTTMCEELTKNILHNQLNLLSCKLFWDGEGILLLDDNFVDEYTRKRLYDALLELAKKEYGYSTLEEIDWWFE